MCRAARTLCQTSPQHCRVGQLCNTTNMLLTTANTATGALSSAASCRGMNLARAAAPHEQQCPASVGREEDRPQEE